MPYQLSFYNDLITIKNLINENKFDGPTGAEAAFKLYLTSIKTIGSYDKVNWPEGWCKEVYKFGNLFKSKAPASFLKEVDEAISTTSIITEIEVLEFIKSEILVNVWPIDKTINYFIELNKKFSLNPEFYHSLGVLYSENNNQIPTKKSLENYRLASKLNETNNQFLESEVNAEIKWIDALLKENKFDQAKNLSLDLYNNARFKTYELSLYGLIKRIEDHILIQERIENITKEAKETISSERIKLIELLGFFSAIMAVLFSIVSKQTGDLKNSFKFLIVLGLFLNIFLISISYVFPRREKKFELDFKFTALCIMIIALILLFMIYN